MSAAKKRKVDSERRVFKKEWTTKYFFTEVGSTAVCLICQKNVAVLKEYNIRRHFDTNHANYRSSLSTQQREVTSQRLVANFRIQQSSLFQQSAVHASITKASFLLAFKIAQASKPFSDGEFIKECMVETAGLLCPDTKSKYEQISLSRRTVTRRIEQIDEHLANELKGKADSFVFYSLALDESNDVRGTAQLLIFVRGINDNFEIIEELLAMESLKGTTRGEDLFLKVTGVIDRFKLPWNKLTNVTTDGSPNLTGKNVGLLKRLQDKMNEENAGVDVIFLHCIIHQEALCKSVLQLNHVVTAVVKLINYIKGRGLHHRQFIKFLEEIDSDHQDLLYHSHVRWLSLGKACKRFWNLKEAITSFLKSIGKADEFSELEDRDWLCDFAFSVDILTHMNELNAKLQGKELFAHDMYTSVTAFKSKLALFSAQMTNNSFVHFPTLLTMKEAPKHANKYSKSLNDLHHEFCRRFLDFEKLQKPFQIISAPLSQVAATAPQELQLELIDLQSDYVLNEKFKTLKLSEFYASLSNTRFPEIRKMAQKMLVLFGSTYICEQTFSLMNFNKSSHRSQLSDAHLKSILTISTTKMMPNFDALAKNKA